MALAKLVSARPGSRWHTLIIVAIVVATLYWSLRGVELFEADLDDAPRRIAIFLDEFFPPDLTPELLRLLGASLLETIQMAYAGTLLGALVAIPLAILATRIIVGRIVSNIVRVLLAVARTIPSIVWALILAIIVKRLGPLPGMLGIAMYTVGYLGKLYYEVFEGTDPEVLEAMRATGVSRWRLARHAVLPEAANPILSQLLFIFEYNVRASSILGFVGAGGIGFYIQVYFERLLYDRLSTVLLMLLVVVIAIDVLSGQLRRRFLLQSAAANPA